MAKTNKEDYQVGYKKPPRANQFKPGQSGNARGRPKKSPAPTDLLRKQLRKIVNVTGGGKIQRVSMLEAVIMKLASLAASGDYKSISLVFAALKPNESEQDNNLPELLQQFRVIHASHAADQRVHIESCEGGQTEKD
jgi:Family of unknown function (DUF5681)